MRTSPRSCPSAGSIRARTLGGSGLHPRGGEGSLEIGYWIRADSIGKGLATEVTAVLARAAIEKCGLVRIDVQVDPANERSLAVPRKLGFTEEATLRRRLPPKVEGGERRDATVVEDEIGVFHKSGGRGNGRDFRSWV